MSPRFFGHRLGAGLVDWGRLGILTAACLAVLVFFGPGCHDSADDDFVATSQTSIAIKEELSWETGDSVYDWNAPGGVARMTLEVDDFSHGDLRIQVFDALGVEILDNLYKTIDWFYYIDGEYYDLDFTDPGAAGRWTIVFGFREFTGDVHLILEDLDEPVDPGDDEVDPPANTSAILDANFGTDGRASYLDDIAVGKRILADSAGRPVVVGTIVDAAGDRRIAVWRFLVDGSPDGSFGAGGVSVFPGAAVSGGFDLAIDGSDRLLVSGWVSADRLMTDLAVLRLTPTGFLDGTFGAGGTVMLDAGLDEVGISVGADGAGRVLLAGASQDVGTGAVRILVVRLETAGALDPSFGFGGIAQTLGPKDMALDLVVDGSDRPVVVGTQGESMALWRLTTGGTPDPTFGTSGLVTSSGGTGEVRVGRSIALAADGSFAVSGVRFFDTIAEVVYLALWRFDSAGSPITSFGGTGFQTYSFPSGWATGADVAFDATDNILVVGRTRTVGLAETDGSATLWRFLPSGTLDSTLVDSGGTGVTRFDPRSGDVGTGASSIALLPSGDLFVSGAAIDRTKNAVDLVVWKLQP